MEYEIQIVSNPKQLSDFLRLPYKIYDNNPNWVAQMKSEVKRVLNPEKNPYFAEATLHLYCCYKFNEICSRVALIINKKHEQKYGGKGAFFGFFESIDDPVAVAYLFETIEHYCIFNGITNIEGPFNPNHYSELGLLSNQFDTLPTFFQTYNPAYYHKLLDYSGFYVSKKIHTRSNKNIQRYLKDHYKEDVNFTENGFTVRPFRKKDFETELEHLRDVFNDAFSENWHFLPVSSSEYLFCAKYLNLVTYPELIQFIEHDGKPIAAIQFVLDINPYLQKFTGKANPIKYLRLLINKKKIKKLIIFAVGVKKSYRRTHAFPLLLQTTINISRKYEILETTWTSDDNEPAIRAANLLGLKPDKQFYIYKKQLNMMYLNKGLENETTEE
jgi:hypothetical protein